MTNPTPNVVQGMHTGGVGPFSTFCEQGRRVGVRPGLAVEAAQEGKSGQCTQRASQQLASVHMTMVEGDSCRGRGEARGARGRAREQGAVRECLPHAVGLWLPRVASWGAAAARAAAARGAPERQDVERSRDCAA